MGEPDDLFDLYRADRGPSRPLTEAALAQALGDNLRQTLATIDRLTAEVAAALAQARYTIRLAPTVTERASYARLDRTSETFRDFLRLWCQRRAESKSGGLHWEATIIVADHRRNTTEIGLGLTIEWPGEDAGADRAFVEFWTNGQGVPLPSDARGFQRALVASIVRFEEQGTLVSAKPRGG